MSESLLERISKKSLQKRKKPVKLLIKNKKVEIKIPIKVEIDKNYDIDSIRQRLKQRGLSVPQIGFKKSEKTDIQKIDNIKPSNITDKDIPSEKPIKIKKKIKLPGDKVENVENVEKENNKKNKTKNSRRNYFGYRSYYGSS